MYTWVILNADGLSFRMSANQCILCGHLITTTTSVDNVGSPDASSSAGHTSKAGVIDVGSNSVDDVFGIHSNTSTGEYSVLILLSSVTSYKQIMVTDNGQVPETPVRTVVLIRSLLLLFQRVLEIMPPRLRKHASGHSKRLKKKKTEESNKKEFGSMHRYVKIKSDNTSDNLNVDTRDNDSSNDESGDDVNIDDTNV
nr:zinc finger MYM-type protein 1 [Tanacetum cinerariifolium]